MIVDFKFYLYHTMTKTKNITTNPILNFLTNKRLAFVRHALFVLIMAMVFNLLTPETLKLYAEKVNVPFEVFYIGQFFDMLFSLGLIYFNLYFLFPRYFKKGLYTHYLGGILFSGTLFFLIAYVIQQIYVIYFGKHLEYAVQLSVSAFIENVTFPIVFLCATTGYKVFKEWINDQERFAELEKQKMNTELAQLKNQVNPHFLFNTLNNLHVLIQTNPKKASDIVLGLSDVLRFQIYDSQHDKVLLGKDIEIIEQYLELEKIRRDNLHVKIEIKGSFVGVFVPPLLFINFVDNAIKHSNARGESLINILFEIKNKELYFTISNSKAAQKTEHGNGGLGLPNIKKRLELLYCNTHTLEILDNSDLFSVKLKIPL
jgi:sensor histidine kinase YesM